MSPLEFVGLILLGGLLGLDVVSFPQAMISRPLVGATLAGALVGAPVAGLLAGAVLELIALETLPFGASRYPEWGSASVVGGVLYAASGEYGSAALATAIVAAVATAWVGGWSMVLLRRMNARWARSERDEIDAGSRDAVNGLQLRGLTADLLRAAGLTGLALAVALPVHRAAIEAWSVRTDVSAAVVVGLAAAVALAAVWNIFHITRGARWLFLAGAVAAGVVLAL